MFKVVLVVIAVSNARFYHEEPKYVIEFPTAEACQAEAKKYPTGGVYFDKAICVPKLEKK